MMPGIYPSATPGALNRTTLPLPAQADPATLVARWAVAGTLVAEPYPCKCAKETHYTRPVSAYCDCVGRTDACNLAPDCCSSRALAGAPVTPRVDKPRSSRRDYRRSVTDVAP